jgi:hypothetical protein
VEVVQSECSAQVQVWGRVRPEHAIAPSPRISHLTSSPPKHAKWLTRRWTKGTLLRKKHSCLLPLHRALLTSNGLPTSTEPYTTPADGDPSGLVLHARLREPHYWDSKFGSKFMIMSRTRSVYSASGSPWAQPTAYEPIRHAPPPDLL